MSVAPLPCPFCGSMNGTDLAGETYRWRLWKCECGAQGPDVRCNITGSGQGGVKEARELAIAEWNTRSADATQRALFQMQQAAKELLQKEQQLRAQLSLLTEWMVNNGLLTYHGMCKRPDGTSGPAWVVRQPAVINGSSCEAWHTTSAAGAVDEWISEKGKA